MRACIYSQKFNGCTLEVWEGISNFIQKFTRRVIIIHAAIVAKLCYKKGVIFAMAPG